MSLATFSDYITNFLSFETRLIFGCLQLAVVIVGLIGNILSIAVLTRPKRRSSSTATYLTALAFSDILILLSGPLIAFFYLVFGFDPRDHGMFWCKFLYWIISASSTTSSWLLVAVTIERTVSVTLPYQVKRSCTPKIARSVVIAIWCVMYVLHSHFLYGMGVVHFNGYNFMMCTYLTNDYTEFAYYVLPWIDITMLFGIPCCIIIIGNVVIIVKLKRNVIKRQHMTTSKKRHTETSLIVTLAVVNITFVLTVTPLTIYLMIRVYLKLTLYAQVFLESLLHVLANVNAAANFFLYFLSGAKFRTDVKELFKSLKMKFKKGGPEQQVRQT